jgi:hypothetical protein
VTGGEDYNFTTTLPFGCELFTFADQYIRLHYQLAPEAVAQVQDTRVPEVTETNTLLFKRSSNFR